MLPFLLLPALSVPPVTIESSEAANVLQTVELAITETTILSHVQFVQLAVPHVQD